MTKKNSALVLAAALAAFSLVASSCSQPTVVNPEKYALVIGISDYKNLPPPDPYIASDLTYPRKDAESLQTLLEKDPAWNVSSLFDLAATKSAILNTITTFFESIPDYSNSIALVYFSGHGYSDSSTGVAYLVPTDFSNTATISQLISPAELSALITSYSPTKNVIFISDSCYSGNFVASGDSIDSITSPYPSWGGNTVSVSSLAALGDFGTLLVKNAQASGALAPIAISASGDLESSYEVGTLGTTTLNHGVFTYYLLESAANGDVNSDGYVTCTEAYTYAAKAIDKYWNNIYSYYGFYPHISGGLRDLVLFDSH